MTGSNETKKKEAYKKVDGLPVTLGPFTEENRGTPGTITATACKLFMRVLVALGDKSLIRSWVQKFHKMLARRMAEEGLIGFNDTQRLKEKYDDWYRFTGKE